jgi:hypothetical protein
MCDIIHFFQTCISLLGAPAALIAAGTAIGQLKNGNREKALEIRQKQAAAAQGQLKELFGSSMARDAMKMMDWAVRVYPLGNGTCMITTKDLIQGLGITYLDFNAKEQYIRDCFEEFFDKIQIMAHLVNIEYLHFKDLAVPLVYYAQIIHDNPKTYSAFLDTYGYALTKKFLNDTLTPS